MSSYLKYTFLINLSTLSEKHSEKRLFLIFPNICTHSHYDRGNFRFSILPKDRLKEQGMEPATFRLVDLSPTYVYVHDKIMSAHHPVSILHP